MGKLHYYCKFSGCPIGYYSKIRDPTYRNKRYHKFPKPPVRFDDPHPDMNKIWRHACGVQPKDSTKYSSVCDDRFGDSDYTSSRDSFLKESAVPKNLFNVNLSNAVTHNARIDDIDTSIHNSVESIVESQVIASTSSLNDQKKQDANNEMVESAIRHDDTELPTLESITNFGKNILDNSNIDSSIEGVAPLHNSQGNSLIDDELALNVMESPVRSTPKRRLQNCKSTSAKKATRRKGLKKFLSKYSATTLLLMLSLLRI
ncbi:hypothetical protein QAD02_012569 [Eretmocerus hayati]|uniref:Uncharacterized protein n=1 Tax=Eretmocerus hayati TaxID=131215 RepID=A0ACC2P2W0_9HYME|nr:hypothetical protein QAD02_012569 [Eretmocerus hayati]